MSRKPVWSIQIRQFDEPLATIRCDRPNGIESESETLMIHLVSDSGDIYPLAGIYGLSNHELRIIPCCDSDGIVSGTKYHPTEEKHSTTLKVVQSRKAIEVAERERERLAELSPDRTVDEIYRLVRCLGWKDAREIRTVEELSDALDYVEVAYAVSRTDEVE